MFVVQVIFAALEVMLFAATALMTGGVTAAIVVNVKSPLVAWLFEASADFTR
jgi:hypothetical protein